MLCIMVSCRPRSHPSFTLLSSFSSFLITLNYTSSNSTLLTKSLSFNYSISVICHMGLSWGDEEPTQLHTCRLRVNEWYTVTNHWQTLKEVMWSWCTTIIYVVMCGLKSWHREVCILCNYSQLTYHGNWNLNCVIGELVLTKLW